MPAVAHIIPDIGTAEFALHRNLSHVVIQHLTIPDIQRRELIPFTAQVCKCRAIAHIKLCQLKSAADKIRQFLVLGNIYLCY